MGKIKTGLIGCGRIGYAFDLDEKREGVWTHAGAYDQIEEVDFVGVYDTYEIVKEAAAYYNVKMFSNLAEVVQECDVISVAVPQSVHERVLNDLLEEFEKATHVPKILWVEKPFTADYDLARKFVDKFAAYNCHININYQRRWCPGFKLLKDRGAPRHVDVTYVRGLYNTASHFVDLMVGLYGEPYKVTVSAYNSDFVLHYKSIFGLERQDFRINFSMLEGIRYNVCDTVFYYPTEVVKVPPLQTYHDVTPAVVSKQYSEYLDLGEPERFGLWYEPMLEQVSMFVEAIKTNKYHKLNNGLSTLQILEKVSNDKGKISL